MIYGVTEHMSLLMSSNIRSREYRLLRKHDGVTAFEVGVRSVLKDARNTRRCNGVVSLSNINIYLKI